MTEKNKNILVDAVDIARSYGFNITVDDVIDRWSEPHRHWHVLDHLFDMLNDIKELYSDKKINDREYNIMVVAAIFHDIVYNPKRTDNKEKSIQYMNSQLTSKDLFDKSKLSNWRRTEDTIRINEIILGTKIHDSKDSLCKKFNKLDTKILDAQFIEMLDWENKIYKEYEWAGWKRYKKNRIKFLLSYIKDHTHNAINIKNLIDYIKNKKLKIGVYYCEIDKLQDEKDYIDNINKIGDLFDRVIIVVIYNESNYSRDKIGLYNKIKPIGEFKAFNHNSFKNYFDHQKDDFILIKDIELINDYDKDITKYINSHFDIFKTIYYI